MNYIIKDQTVLKSHEIEKIRNRCIFGGYCNALGISLQFTPLAGDERPEGRMRVMRRKECVHFVRLNTA